MAFRPVEWVLVVYYGPAAHQATYGRLGGLGYTKDFIQLSKKRNFLEAMAHVLSVPAAGAGIVPITYKWPQGSARGDFVFRSADRPHLKWVTAEGAPAPWRMALLPSDMAPETIPGDPGCLKIADAQAEFSKIASRGGGQPYLMAIKLKGEQRVFHLRAYLEGASDEFAWADLKLVPDEIRALALKTSRTSALAWSLFNSDGIPSTGSVKGVVSRLATSKDSLRVLDNLDDDMGRALADYLHYPGDGLFFDPELNHDAWSRGEPLPMPLAERLDELLPVLDSRLGFVSVRDAVAEHLDVDPIAVDRFRDQIKRGSYAVADTVTMAKTRGSAQKAFADVVKANYGYCCAISGMATRDFLVASHIVPWSEDESIRLDPANGICLSLLMDRAFEKGYLTIDDGCVVHVDGGRVGADDELRSQLQRFNGKVLSMPKADFPLVEYLRRRRALVATENGKSFRKGT